MSNETPPFRDHPAVRAVIGFGRAPDPVDAAIERHRAAREELQRASNGVDAAMTASKRAEAEADAVFSAASNADGAAWADLLAIRPGDVPGAVRLLRYVSGSPASEVVEDPQDLLRQLLAAVEAGETGERQGEGAPAGGDPLLAGKPDLVHGGGSSLGYGPDAEIVALATDFFRAFTLNADADRAVMAGSSTEAEWRPGHDAVVALMDRLEQAEPKTLLGMALKCLAPIGEAAWHNHPDDARNDMDRWHRVGEQFLAAIVAGSLAPLPAVGPEAPSGKAPVSPALAELIARHRDLVRQSEARGLSDAVADPLFDEAWAVFRQACSFPIAGPADLAAKLDLMAAEITEGVERGEIDTATHAWNCLRADLVRLGALDGLCADGSDTELLALAPIWEAARDLYERRVQEQIAVSDAASDIEAPPSRDLPHEEWMRLVEGWRERTGVAAVETAVGQALGDLGKIEDRIAALPASSLAGLHLKAMIARRHEDDDVEWPAGLGAGIARDLLSLKSVQPTAPADPAEEAVDWHVAPPGFMASPAIEPYSFARIPEGIAIELGRLRGIALAELERRSVAGMTPEGEERLRRDLHLDTLSKATRGEGGFAVWPTPGAEAASVRDWQAEAAMHPGFVPYPAHAPRILMDLEGAIRGETGRLLELAEAEIARRRAAYDGFHDPSVWPQLERDLRREMRMDALAVAAGSMPADDGAADPRLCALVTAWEAAERAGNAPGRSDEERAPLIDHASGLLRDLYAFPARTMADICAKLPAFRDEAANTGDALDAPDSEVTLEACALRGLVADLERLAEARATGAVGEPVPAAGPDPMLAAIAASRRAEAEMAAFQDSMQGENPPGWKEREGALCRAQLATREAVWRTVPVTQAGRRALVEYARFQVEVHTGETGIIDNAKALFEEILAPIAAAVDAERPDAASAGAETLVERLLATWAALARAEDASDDATSEVLLEHRAALLREAERLPATRPHLIAKALAFAWIGHAHLWRVGQAREDYAIDGRLALDIEATARIPARLES